MEVLEETEGAQYIALHSCALEFDNMSFKIPWVRKTILKVMEYMKNDTTFVRMRSSDHLG